MNNVIIVAREARPRKDNEDACRCAESVQRALQSKSIAADIFFMDASFFEDGAQKLERWLADTHPDCVFNLFEGFSDDAYKEIEFVEALEQNGIVFTGNSSRALAACLNKAQCKSMLTDANIAVPRGMVVKGLDDLTQMDWGYPVFIKPCGEDASVGIDASSLCRDKAQLIDAVGQKAKLFDSGLMVEEFIDGNEYNVSFMDAYPYQVLAVSRINYEDHPQCLPFISYESKWDETARDFQELIFQVQQECAPQVQEVVDRVCREAGRVLSCRGYFRVDLRERAGAFYVLDVNPNPDINEDSGFIRQAKSAGFSYADIIQKIFLGAFHG